MVVVTRLPRVSVSVAVAIFGALMVSNVGRMIAAMAMVTSSVEPSRRGRISERQLFAAARGQRRRAPIWAD